MLYVSNWPEFVVAVQETNVWFMQVIALLMLDRLDPQMDLVSPVKSLTRQKDQGYFECQEKANGRQLLMPHSQPTCIIVVK